MYVCKLVWKDQNLRRATGMIWNETNYMFVTHGVIGRPHCDILLTHLHSASSVVKGIAQCYEANITSISTATFSILKLVITSFFPMIFWAPFSSSSFLFHQPFISSVLPISHCIQLVLPVPLAHLNPLLPCDWWYTWAVPSVLRLCLSLLGRNKKSGDRSVQSLRERGV